MTIPPELEHKLEDVFKKKRPNFLIRLHKCMTKLFSTIGEIVLLLMGIGN